MYYEELPLREEKTSPEEHQGEESKCESASLKDLANWKIKRKQTLIVFIIQLILMGLDYGIILPTLSFYLAEVDAHNKNILYGLAFGLYTISGLVGSIVFGKIADDTRNIRAIMFVIMSSVIIGGIVYSLGFSAYPVIIGRFFAGLGMAFDTVATGELARSYNEKDLTSIIATYNIGGSIGWLVAPGLNIIFKDFNIHLGYWHITYKNAGPLIISAVLAFVQIFAFKFVHDLSKEYDLKEHSRKIQMEATCSDPQSNETQPYKNEADFSNASFLRNSISKIVELLKRCVLLVLFYVSFTTGVNILAFETLLSLLATNVLKWSMEWISITFVLAGVIFITLSALIYRFNRIITDYNLIIAGLVTEFIGCICLWAFDHCSGTLRVAFYCIMVIEYSFAFVVLRIPLLSITAKLVLSSEQNITEGIRFSVAAIGHSLGALLSGLLIDHLTPYAVCLANSNLVGLILLIMWRKEINNSK